MITPENITRKQAKKLVKLLERDARYEVLARLGAFTDLECIDYAVKQIENKDRIREMLFDTSNLVELGENWGILKKRKNDKRTKHKELS